jgi:AGZA family xanthine/uracil permease-like MFS transporter
VAIGIFQAFIGFRMIGLVVGDAHTLVALGDITSPTVLLSLGTTFLIAALVVLRVQGAMLIGIGVSSCVSWFAGFHALPVRIVEMPTMQFYWSQLDWATVGERWEEALPITLAFLFVCIFDTAGVQFGAGMQAGLLDDKGELHGTKAAFLAASVATGLGGLLGTSPTIIHNETCAGIAEGGRTGLTALVVALMFALSIFFVPVLAAVPLTATAPALIVVGVFMMGPAGAMDWDDFRKSLPAFMTITTMPLTYSIANGVVAGLLSFAIIELLTTSMLWETLARIATCGKLGRGEGAGALLEPLSGGNARAKSPGVAECLANASTSACASPHAMVRNPLRASSASTGLSGWPATSGATPSSSPIVATDYVAPGGGAAHFPAQTREYL